jgi:hypothetical protein
MNRILVMLVLLGGLGMAGCTTEPESIINPEDGTVTIDREGFKERVEARLQEFELRLDKLRNKVIDARAEVRAKLREDIDELHRKQVAARERLAEMLRRGGEKWEEETQRVESALEELRVGFEQAFSHCQ